MRQLLLIATFMICFVGQAQENQPSYTYDNFRELLAESQGNTFLKFVYFKYESGSTSLHLIPRNFQLHYEYVASLPKFSGLSRQEIHRLSNQVDGPFVFGNIFLPPPDRRGISAQYYEMNFVSDQAPRAKDLIAIYRFLQNILQSSEYVFHKYNLYYAPTPRHQDEARAEATALMAEGVKIKMGEGLEYPAAYTEGWSVGQLKALPPNADLFRLYGEGKIDSRSILVMEETPAEIPPVAGLLVRHESFAGSHPALLLKMYQAVFAYVPKNLDSNDFDELVKEEAYVFVVARPLAKMESSANPRSLIVSKISRDEAQTLRALKSETSIGSLPLDVAEKRILLSDASSQLSVAAYGAKARGIDTLVKKLPADWTLPFAIAIPIFYQKAFFSQSRSPDGTSSLADFVRKRMSGMALRNPLEKSALLKEIRDAILAAPLDSKVLSEITTTLVSLSKNSSDEVFFRSSSNAEDHPLFNGAGLYDSKRARLSQPATVELALKRVWASLYSDRAYGARELFHVDESSVGMGVSVNPFYSQLKAQGVGILAVVKGDSAAAKAEYELTLTGFPGSQLQVTSPPAGKNPEIVVNNGYGPQTIAFTSELPLGQNVLTLKSYEALHSAAVKVAEDWPKALSQDKSFSLDFEWGVIDEGGQERVIVWQVRDVPEADASRFENFAPILVGSQKAKAFRLANGEQSGNAPFVYLSHVEAEFEFGNATFSEKHFKDYLRNVTLKFDFGDYRLDPAKIKVLGLARTAAKKYEPETYYAILSLPGIARYPDLKLEVSFPVDRLKNGMKAKPLATAADLEFSLLFKKKSVCLGLPNKKAGHCESYESEATKSAPQRKILKDYDTYQKVELRSPDPLARDRDESEKMSYTTTYRQSARDEGVRVEIDWYTKTLRLEAKHWDVNLTEVRVQGLVPGKTIVIRDPMAMIYDSSDHHMDREFWINLAHSNLSREDLEAVNKRGGPFLLIQEGTWVADEHGPEGSQKEVPGRMHLIDTTLKKAALLQTFEVAETPGFQSGG